MENKPLYSINSEAVTVLDSKTTSVFKNTKATICTVNLFDNYIFVPCIERSTFNHRYISPAAFRTVKERTLKTRAVFSALKKHFDKESFLVLEYYDRSPTAYISSKNYRLTRDSLVALSETLEIGYKIGYCDKAGLVILFKEPGAKTLTKLTKCFGVLDGKL